MKTELKVTDLQCLLGYDEMTGIFTWKESRGRKKRGDVAGFVRADGYVRIKLRGKDYLAHRLAWMYVNGHLPELFIDHINHDRRDNRIANLRLVTNQENQFHQRSPLGCGKTGNDRRWEARIKVNRKLILLGRFDTEEEARMAYLEAKKTYHQIVKR